MKTKAEKSRINYQFTQNQKQVYRSWKEEKIDIKRTPPTDEVKGFWQGIWEKDTEVELDTDWHKKLKETYCKDVVTKQYKIDKVVFQKAVNRVSNKPQEELLSLDTG